MVKKPFEILKDIQDGIGYAVERIDHLRHSIYPNVETCDCEAPCSCQYPEGWIELVNLKYHLLGMAVGAEEDLVGGLDENLYRNNQTEPVGTDS